MGYFNFQEFVTSAKLNAITDANATGTAQNAYRTLQANNIFVNGDYLAADEFVVAEGTNGTVETQILNPQDPTQDTTVEGSTYVAWTNVENAFDGNEGTYANYQYSSSGNRSNFIGKEFSAAKFIEFVRFKGGWFNNGTNGNFNRVTIQKKLQGVWENHKVIFEGTGTSELILDETINLYEEVEGVRVLLFADPSGTSWVYHRVYTLEYGSTSGSSASFEGDSYVLLKKDAEIESDSTGSNYTTSNNDPSILPVTVTKSGFFSTVRVYYVNGEVNITIRDLQGNPLVSKNDSRSNSGTSTVGFSASEYSRAIAAGETVEVVVTRISGTLRQYPYPAFNGSLFSYPAQERAHGGASSTLTYTTQELEINTGTVICNKNILTLDGDEQLSAVYFEADIPGSTSIDVAIGDGTTELTTTVNKRSTGAVDVSGLNAGTLSVKFTLNSSDGANTPKLYGYGVLLY